MVQGLEQLVESVDFRWDEAEIDVAAVAVW